MNISDLTRNFGHVIRHNAPAILTGLAVSGTVATAVLAARASLKVGGAIVQDMYDNHLDDDYEPTWKDLVKDHWKVYIPAAGTLVLTGACIIGSQSINTRRQAALISAYTLTSRAFDEYKDKAIETFGEKGHQKVYDGIAKDKVDAIDADDSRLIILDTSKQRIFEDYTRAYFESDVESIRQAVNEINAMCNSDMYATLNDFYDKIGLDRSTLGETVGWTTERPMTVRFSTIMAKDNKPTVSMIYDQLPFDTFHRLY